MWHRMSVPHNDNRLEILSEAPFTEYRQSDYLDNSRQTIILSNRDMFSMLDLYYAN